MLLITIPLAELPNLGTGVAVRINGQEEMISLRGDSLIYGDDEGGQIIEVSKIVDGRGVPCLSFFCAS